MFISLIAFVLIINYSTSALDCSKVPQFAKDTITCCKIPSINLGGIPLKCQNYVQSLPSWNPNFEAYNHVCYADCIYKETGAMVSGDLDMEKVQAFLQQNIQNTDFVPIIMESFKTCIANVKGHMDLSKVQMYPPLPEGCSPYSTIIWRCVNTETFIKCPVGMWRNDLNCNAAKLYAVGCNPLPHGPLPVFDLKNN